MDLDLDSEKNFIHSTLEIVRKKFPTLLLLNADQKDLFEYEQIIKIYKFLEKYEYTCFQNNHLLTCVKRNLNYQGDCQIRVFVKC